MKNGGAAFPYSYEVTVDYRTRVYHNEGMTLRDYFAGQALAGNLKALIKEFENGGGAAWHFSDVADWAYGIADAMLAEREIENS